MVRTDGGLIDVEAHGFAWREHSWPTTGGGEATAPTVILLHGLMGSRLSWDTQLGRLGSVRTAAWDMPGYGSSESLGSSVDFEQLAVAVVRFADAIGADTYHLVGISFGGMIAQYVAAAGNARVQSLSLLATSPCFGLDGTRPDEWRRARLAQLDAGLEPVDLAEPVLRTLAGPHISKSAIAAEVAAASRVSAGALRRSIDCLVTHDSRKLLGTITAPTLCLVGEDDQETPPSYARHLANHIPRARLVTVPGAGHLLNAEASSVVNDQLRNHIEAHA